MVQTSPFPSRAEPKMMRRPSGDQAGCPSRPFARVRRRGSVPSAFMTYTSSPSPSRSESKAMRLPSREQEGDARVANGQAAFAGAVGPYGVEVERAVSARLEEDRRAVRRPRGVGVVAVAGEREASLA